VAPRIGWISYTPPGDAFDSFQYGMRSLGYSGSNTVGVEVRVPEANTERVRAAYDELTRFPSRSSSARPPSRPSFTGSTPGAFRWSSLSAAIR
jgi:hypothetical protein